MRRVVSPEISRIGPLGSSVRYAKHAKLVFLLYDRLDKFSENFKADLIS
jgi:hypothetical protein